MRLTRMQICPLVREAPRDGGAHGAVEIGSVEHDEGAVSAELEVHALDVATSEITGESAEGGAPSCVVGAAETQ